MSERLFSHSDPLIKQIVNNLEKFIELHHDLYANVQTTFLLFNTKRPRPTTKDRKILFVRISPLTTKLELRSSCTTTSCLVDIRVKLKQSVKNRCENKRWKNMP